MRLSILAVLLVLISITSAQESGSSKKEKYDSLKIKRTQLIAEKESLKLAIEKDEKTLDSLKQLVKNSISALYIQRYGKDYGTRVANGQVWKGMTDKMLRDSWGKPDKIDKNVEKWGVFTQWYYGTITYFFRDGKLTDWEDSAAK